jgi:methionyl-tRNA synthetase
MEQDLVIEKGYTVVKIANSNVKIDLENATKIYDMISKNVIPFHAIWWKFRNN